MKIILDDWNIKTFLIQFLATPDGFRADIAAVSTSYRRAVFHQNTTGERKEARHEPPAETP